MDKTLQPKRRLAAIFSGTALAAVLALGATSGWAQPCQDGAPGRPGMGMGMGMGMQREGRGGPGAMMMQGFPGGRMLDAVGASAEQKSRIQAIMGAARTDMQAQHDAQRQLRQQVHALFVAPQVDAAAAESLRQQIHAGRDAASKRMLQAMLDASAVLTPEQRQKLGERMATRHEMMQRHMRERRSMDGMGR